MTSDILTRSIVLLDPARTTEPPPWLFTLQRDLARDTAEAAFTELFAIRSDVSDEVTQAVVLRLIERMKDMMAAVYRELGIQATESTLRLRFALGTAFLERFDELTANLDRGGLA